jgi:hypothetical protein
MRAITIYSLLSRLSLAGDQNLTRLFILTAESSKSEKPVLHRENSIHNTGEICTKII